MMLDDLPLVQNTPAKSGSFDIWIKALSSPTEQTYENIINHPDAAFGKALYWLFIAGGSGGLLASLVQTVFNTNSFFGLSSLQVAKEISASAIVWSFLGAVLFSIGVPVITLINTGLIHLTSRALGAETNYTKLFFAFAAYQTPLVLLISVLGGIPTLGCITFPMILYWLFLSVRVTQIISKLEIRKTVVCNLSPFVLGGTLGFCALAVILAATIEIT